MKLSIVVAAAENNVIGKDNKLPWHLPDDMRHFKEATLGKPVIMGRKTYESIGHALPGRRNIVITRQKDFALGDAVVVHSLDDAIHAAKEDHAEEACVIGGADIFRQAMEKADVIHFTRVHTTVEGDAFFPEIDPDVWRAALRGPGSPQKHDKDARHDYAFTFVDYKRRIQQ